MPEVIVRGTAFHVEVTDPPESPAGGTPPVVVFVHGLGADDLSGLGRALAAPVSEVGVRVVRYDLRGHGRSGRPATGYRVADAVADLFALLDALGHRHPVYLVGAGFGGAIALSAAVSRPRRVAGLVLVEACGPGDRAGEWIEDLLNAFGRAALVLEYERFPDRPPVLGRSADALAARTSLLDDLAAAEPVPPAALATVACPMLAVYGECSELGEVARLLVRSVPGCTLHIVAGRGHGVLTDGLDEILEVMVLWLALHTGASTPDGARALAGGGAE